MLTTNQKGAVAETAIAHEAIKLGIGVWVPLMDEPCDLLLDLRPKILRVQCKWAVRSGDVVSIRTRRSCRTREGLLGRSYDPNEIDVIAAYCPDTGRAYLLPHELSVDRAQVHLRLGAPRNNQSAGIRWARDYEFGATIRRLLGP